MNQLKQDFNCFVALDVNLSLKHQNNKNHGYMTLFSITIKQLKLFSKKKQQLNFCFRLLSKNLNNQLKNYVFITTLCIYF